MFCERITLKSGQIRWSCVADGPKDPVTGKRKQVPRRGKTKREAMERVRNAIDKMTKHGIDETRAQRMTFEELAALWLKEYRITGVKNNTADTRESHFKKIFSYIGKMKVSDIELETYQFILNDWFEKGAAVSSIRNYHATSSLIFKYAARNKILEENPIEEAFVPKKVLTVEEAEDKLKGNLIKEKFFESEELDLFLKVASEQGLLFDAEFFHVGAFSGLRPGEICALQRPDLYFDRNAISVTKTIYSKTKRMNDYELTPPKNYHSIREVEVDPGVMDMLQELMVFQDKIRKMNLKNKDYHDGNFVFSRPNGYPYTVGFFDQRMERLMKRTGMTKHATPHMLRHTHVSMLTEAGADLPYIMDRVGHKDAKTTREVYTHVSKKKKKTVSQDMHKKFGGIVRPSKFMKNLE